jgi:hypothetical protein
MSKRLLVRILICAVGVLLLLGSSLTVCFLANPDDKRPDTTVIVIPQNGESSENEVAVNFEAPKIHPGENVKHTVELKGEVDGETEITLKFKENRSRINDLAKYLNVKVTIAGAEYCEMLLSELFSAELDTVVCVLNKKTPVIIQISYSMPSEVGNEAADVEAFFSLLITSSNQE